MESNSSIVTIMRHIEKMEKEVRRLNSMKFRQFNALFGLVGSGHVIIGVSGIQIKQGTTVMGEWQTDGDIFIGSNIALPASTYFSILATAQTYNGEAFSAGDMLIGDNSANKANIFWDKSVGRLKFRGGTTTQAWIDTDGSLTAGGGDVKLDADGMSLIADASGIPDPGNANIIKWIYGAFTPLYFGAAYEAAGDLVIAALAVNGNVNERIGELQLRASDSTGTNTASVILTGLVSSSEIVLTASLVTVDGNAAISGGLNVGSASGASPGQIKGSGGIAMDGAINGAGGLTSQYVYDNTSATANYVIVLAAGGLRRLSSSIKYKKNVKDVIFDVDKLMSIKPRTFNSKCKDDNQKHTHIGLIAEELLPIYPELVNVNEETSEVEGVNYGGVGVLALQLAQDNRKKFNELEEKLERMSKNGSNRYN